MHYILRLFFMINWSPYQLYHTVKAKKFFGASASAQSRLASPPMVDIVILLFCASQTARGYRKIPGKRSRSGRSVSEWDTSLERKIRRLIKHERIHQSRRVKQKKSTRLYSKLTYTIFFAAISYSSCRKCLNYRILFGLM